MAAAIKPGLGSIPSSEQKCPPNFTCSATENNLLRICKKIFCQLKGLLLKNEKELRLNLDLMKDENG